MRGCVVLMFVVGFTFSTGLPGTAASEEADNGSTVGSPPAVGTHGTTVNRNASWVALPACPVGASRPAGAVVGDRFFVVGGEETGGARTGYVQEYDPVANTWDSTNALMPTPLSNLCAAVIGTDIYVPGGWNGTVALTTLQIYHTTTDTWETVATDPLPMGLSGPACTTYGGKVYVFGGTDGVNYLNGTYVYDPAAAAGSRWTTGAVVPTIAAYGDAVAAGGYLYYAGMRNSAIADLANVYRYDPVADSWTAMPSLTTARGGAGVWTYEGLLAVGGGGWTSYLTSVEEYDLSTGTGGTWTAGNSLVSGRRTFASAQDDVNGVLYAGAGWAGAYLTSAESSDFVVPVELVSFAVD
jgi:N-acetylneuraminic acid mutarotase